MCVVSPYLVKLSLIRIFVGNLSDQKDNWIFKYEMMDLPIAD